MAARAVDNLVANGTIALGPIESVDSARGLINVLGRSYRAGGTKAQLDAISTHLGSGQLITATVLGSKDRNGKLKPRSLALQPDVYVPGSSPVMLIDKVRRTDSLAATLEVGSISVDYSGLLADGLFTIPVGSTVAIVGVQSSVGSPLVALAIKLIQ